MVDGDDGKQIDGSCMALYLTRDDTCDDRDHPETDHQRWGGEGARAVDRI